MNMKGLMAGMVLAIMILTTTGAASDAPFNAAFSTVYGQVTDDIDAGVNGAEVSLAANGVTLTTVTRTNNRGEKGFYIFELANIPKVTDTTPLTLSVTTSTKTVTTTITRGGNVLQKVDLKVPAPAPVLTTITVSPAAATLNIGGTQLFTATARDQDGAVMTGVTISFTGSNATAGNVTPAIATTGADGTATTTFTASEAGTVKINATNGSIVGNATVSITARVFTISGTVTNKAGVPLAGVTMTLEGAAGMTTTTAAGGTYSFPGLANGSYKVTPAAKGFTFVPKSLSVTIAGVDVGGQNFTTRQKKVI